MSLEFKKTIFVNEIEYYGETFFVPIEYKWIYIDSIGYVWASTEKPIMENGTWVNSEGSSSIEIGFFDFIYRWVDYQKSLYRIDNGDLGLSKSYSFNDKED